MNRFAGPFRFGCLALVVWFAAAGCGPGYPYYTLDGSPESRVVVIHFKDGKTERIPAGTGIGAGLTAEHRAALAMGQDAIIEEGAARVTVSAGGPLGAVVTVKKVEYDGQEIYFHEPVL